jgi:prepilin-type N-terminal cleavage/methylation domain-containing protein
MLSRSCRSSCGFTLVELLVVIAIIAVLAGVLLSAGTAAINAAKRAKATTFMQQIQTACQSYYTEYSVYPVPTGVTATSTDYEITDATGSATSWGYLIEGLAGNVSPYNLSQTGISATTTGINTRGIAFITPKATDVDSNNAPLNPITPATTNPYFNIAMDTDYDGILGVAPSAVTNMPKLSTASGLGTPASGGTTTGGIALWANCNAPGYNSEKSWISTY